MPFVANPGKAATDLVGKLLVELARPLSDRFVADDDAAGRQQLLHHAQPEREAKIQPHRIADDLGRESIPGVAGACGCPHPTRLLTPICSRKRGKAREVDGARRVIRSLAADPGASVMTFPADLAGKPPRSSGRLIGSKTR